MSDVLFIAVMSLTLIYCDFRGTKANWGSRQNGLGAIPEILKGESFAPTQYRVLVPWLCFLLGKGNKKIPYLNAYMGLRWTAIVAALSCVHGYYQNMTMTALLTIFLIAAAIYDYTEVYIEIALLALFFMFWTSAPWIVLMSLVFVAALNRETVLLMPLITLLSGELTLTILLSIIAWCGLLWPRILYRRVSRYCALNMIPENIEEIKVHYRDRPIPYVEYTLFFTMTIAMIVAHTMSEWTPITVATGLLFVALLVPTKWREIRVFAPCVMVMIPMVVK